jgi:uncharacterized radical SAM superfamily Fe-S cluster-containing enzyme
MNHKEFQSANPEAVFTNGTLLSKTESVCPVCLKRLPASRVQYGEDVYLEKECPQHGFYRTVIWRGRPGFAEWVRPKVPVYPQHPFTLVDKGCPFDCGLCADHRQEPCCVLFDVTERCDLKCHFCFASAGKNDLAGEPSLKTIEGWYRGLLQAGGPFNIQLSGGEPCMRDDLPEIIALGKTLGFSFFQLNTNGLRISHDVAYLKKMKDAGLCTVYLQFDGTSDVIYTQMRGRAIFQQKIQAIQNCADLEIGVVLVPTLVPGINTDEIGKIIDLAVAHAPTVRGVHFQPVSYFGRYPQAPSNADRITLPEVIQAIAGQTQGRIQRESFLPPGGENAHCSFHANFVIMPDGELKPLTRCESSSCCSTPEPVKDGSRKSRLVTAKHWMVTRSQVGTEPKQILGSWDDFLDRVHTYSFSISGMAFQDAWNLDLERLRECYIIHVSRDGKLIPFCAYNLTNQLGLSLYRPQTQLTGE